MKYIKQFGIILLITTLGDVIKYFINLPIPGSIYGLVLMLIALLTKIVKIDDVKDTGLFLIEIMPLMFIPVAANLINMWGKLQAIIIPLIIILPLTTIIVMVFTGKITDYIIYNSEDKIK